MQVKQEFSLIIHYYFSNATSHIFHATLKEAESHAFRYSVLKTN